MRVWIDLRNIAEVIMFPEAPRVIYRQRPSEEVICQFRFPTILRIDAQPPADFQDKIRTDYPVFAEKPSTDIPSDLARLFEMQLGSGKKYEFASSDKLWTVHLEHDSLAISTRAYERWEEFRQHFTAPYRALCEIYRPTIFSRIGLRYKDAIRKDKLGLGDASWSDLLKPPIAAEFTSPIISTHIEQVGHRVLVRDEASGMRVLLQHGLGQVAPNQDICYVIDSDFFVDTETRVEHALGVLDAFNGEARRLFYWCITDRLHRSLDPQPA